MVVVLAAGHSNCGFYPANDFFLASLSNEVVSHVNRSENDGDYSSHPTGHVRYEEA